MIASDAINRTSARIVSSEELLRYSGGPLYSTRSPEASDRSEEHDPRGLLVSLGFCGLCWLGLAWFLLS